MGTSGERGRISWLEQRAFGNAHLDQVVEAIVEQDLRVEDHNHIDAEEHPEHIFVQQEVDRTRRLRIGPVEIEDNLFPLAPHGAFDSVGPVADPVIAQIIGETHRFDADRLFDEGLHRAMIAFEQQTKRSHISSTRLAATRQDAMRALRSAAHQSGLRLWCSTSRTRSSLYMPCL